MSGRTMLLAFLATLPFVATSEAPSRVYPIEPRTLRRLVAEATCIVTAKVVAPDPPSGARCVDPANPRRVEMGNVLLVIDEVVKGKLVGKKISLSTDLGMICPAPPHYVLGTHVLAFLDWTKEHGYSTHALSYGAKELDDASMKTYLERVKEEIALLAIEDEAARRKAQVEWLVKCCEDPATRWEGAFDLAPRGDPMGEFFLEQLFVDLDSTAGDGASGTADTGLELDEGFSRDLSDAQRKRLRDAWHSSKRFGVGEMCLDELFLPERDPKDLEWFVARVRDRLKLRGDEEEYVVGAGYLLDRIVRRDDRPAVAALAKEYDKIVGIATYDATLLARHDKILEQLLALY